LKSISPAPSWAGRVSRSKKGSSPQFYPNNVYSPYFYFALALDQDLPWNAATQDGVAELKTSPAISR
jgi:AraC family transcriptional regulator